MLELPARRESSMTLGSRVSRAAGKTSKSDFPRTSSAGCRETRAIQAFHATTHAWRSSTTSPTSTVSKTGPNASSDGLSNMTSCLLFEVSDESLDDSLQGSDGWKIHEQSNKAMDVAILDI